MPCYRRSHLVQLYVQHRLGEVTVSLHFGGLIPVFPKGSLPSLAAIVPSSRWPGNQLNRPGNHSFTPVLYQQVSVITGDYKHPCIFFLREDYRLKSETEVWYVPPSTPTGSVYAMIGCVPNHGTGGEVRAAES